MPPQLKVQCAILCDLCRRTQCARCIISSVPCSILHPLKPHATAASGLSRPGQACGPQDSPQAVPSVEPGVLGLDVELTDAARPQRCHHCRLLVPALGHLLGAHAPLHSPRAVAAAGNRCHQGGQASAWREVMRRVGADSDCRPASESCPVLISVPIARATHSVTQSAPHRLRTSASSGRYLQLREPMTSTWSGSELVQSWLGSCQGSSTPTRPCSCRRMACRGLRVEGPTVRRELASLALLQ